jgi:anti-anti-sigma regulatory factor
MVLIVGGRIDPAAVPVLCGRLRMLLEGSDADLIICDVSALVDPDAVAVEALARLRLTARRLGREILLRHASCELQELLALVGLQEAFAPCAGLPLEPRREPEQREESRGVEEEGDPGDLII